MIQNNFRHYLKIRNYFFALFSTVLIHLTCSLSDKPKVLGWIPFKPPTTPAQIFINSPAIKATAEDGTSLQIRFSLNKSPSSQVSIQITNSNPNEASISTTNLNFTSSNWDTVQILTVTGIDDLYVDGDRKYNINFKITSDDLEFSNLLLDPIEIINKDNDTPGVQVTPRTGHLTSESGATTTFQVFLSSAPTATVTIPTIASSNTLEGTVSPSTLTFTPTNWSIPQTVTITGVDDSIDDGNQNYSIVFGTTTSSDPVYNNFVTTNLNVINADNETGSGITVSGLSGNTTEVGGTATFNVILNTDPTSSVTIQISSSNTNEGTVSPNSLTFNSGNWNITQTVTITGVNDLIQDGNVSYNIIIGGVTSANSNYAGLANQTLSLSNTDNDTAGYTINTTNPFLVTDGGQITSSIQISLNSQPTSNVTIPIASLNTAEANVSVSSVTFTPSNWNIVQTILVSGVNDGTVDGNQAFTIDLAIPTTSDSVYAALNPANQSGNSCDNDGTGVLISVCRTNSTLTTTESGGALTFYLLLSQSPTANVNIGLSSSNTSEGTVSPATITLNTSNWNTFSGSNLITVTGIDDSNYDGDISYNLNFATSSSTDLVFNGINLSPIGLVNQDNEIYFNVSAVTGSPMVENIIGGTASFTIALNSAPSGINTVSIGISSSDATEGTVSPSSVVFNSGNWNTPQTITVTPVDDTIADGNISFTILTASAVSGDIRFNGRNPADRTLVTNDAGEKRTFLTFTTYNGNLGGIAGADTKCNGDTNRPSITPNTYRALVSVNTTRTGNPLAGSWSFAANTTYFRTNGTTNVFPSDAGSIFSFGGLTNSFSGASDEYWTGLNTNWTVGSNCTAWTSSSNAISARYGIGNTTNTDSISIGLDTCDKFKRILCVQQ